jgi:adenine-specific DNA-methyltransferase
MRYYGNKTKLVEFIAETADELKISDDRVFFDIFAGTNSVSKYFKHLGYQVIANDFLYFSYVLAQAYVVNNRVPSFSKLNGRLKHHNPLDAIEYLNELPGTCDFITLNYSPYKKNPRQYFSVENAMKIDAIRKQIDGWLKKGSISNGEAFYLITALLNAINLVSNVSGTYGSYLKSWDKRAHKKLVLLAPDIIPSSLRNKAINKKAEDVISRYKVDILYLDPPYNSRQYASNYFLLELIAEGWFDTKPHIYGHTGMRPYDHQKSTFSMKGQAADALRHLISKAKAKYILMSYSNEGIIPIDEVKDILSTKGIVKTKTFDHKRYRSIGQDGSRGKTIEYLFIVQVKD